MAATKKVNYIGYELKWLEKRCRQLMDWCEEKLDNGIEDRLEETVSIKGNPIIKVIASEETQVRCLRDTLKELPNMLMEINKLRKMVEDEDKGVPSVRGNHDIPGFMEDDDDENEDKLEEAEYEGDVLEVETEKFDDEPVKKEKKQKSKPKKTKEKSPKIAERLKELPAAKDEDELDFEEIIDDGEGDFEDP